MPKAATNEKTKKKTRSVQELNGRAKTARASVARRSAAAAPATQTMPPRRRATAKRAASRPDAAPSATPKKARTGKPGVSRRVTRTAASPPRAAASEGAPASRPAPTHDEVAAHAYQIYLARGEQHGDPIGDWLQAEAELRRQRY